MGLIQPKTKVCPLHCTKWQKKPDSVNNDCYLQVRVWSLFLRLKKKKTQRMSNGEPSAAFLMSDSLTWNVPNVLGQVPAIYLPCPHPLVELMFSQLQLPDLPCKQAFQNSPEKLHWTQFQNRSLVGWSPKAQRGKPLQQASVVAWA